MTPATNAAASQTADVRPQRSLPAAAWLAWYSLREMSRRRRLVALSLICLLPVLMVLAIRIWFSQAGVTAQMMLASLSHDVFMPFLIPVVALFVGVPAIGEQVDDGTIVFTWTRPVRRRAIYLGRLAAAQAVSALVLSFSLADVHPHDLATILDQHGVCIRAGHHCAQPLMRRLGVSATARASFYVYSDGRDVDALIGALAAAQQLFATVD